MRGNAHTSTYRTRVSSNTPTALGTYTSCEQLRGGASYYPSSAELLGRLETAHSLDNGLALTPVVW